MKKVFEFFKRKPFIAITASVSLTAVIVFTVLILTGVLFNKNENKVISSEEIDLLSSLDYEKVNVTALKTDNAGVLLSSGFKLTSSVEMDKNFINSLLKITPEQDYKIKEVSKKEYLITFPSELKADSIYKFTLGGENSHKLSWAFETEKTFKVTGTLPRNKANYVPLNSGIEITMSYEGTENPEKYFSISPKVAGKFELHKKTIVFIPEKLQEGVVYTVTLAKGLPLKNSDKKLEADYSFKFQAGSSSKSSPSLIGYANDFYNFSTLDTPAMELYLSDSLKNSDAAITLYKYPNENKFIESFKPIDSYPNWAYIDRSRILFSTSGLEKAYTFNLKPTVHSDEWWSKYYTVLPSEIAPGHYLVETKIKDVTTQTHLQINDASVYMSVAKNKTIAWVNDSKSGSAVKSAKVEATGVKAVNTDTDGIAVINEKIPQPANDGPYYFKVSCPGKPVFVVRMPSQELANQVGQYSYYNYYNSSLSNNYWNYLYLDRGMYLPTDTVNLWGVIKSRNGLDEIKKATVRLVSLNVDTSSPTAGVLQEKEISLSGSGIFSSSIDYVNLSSGTYEVKILSGDKEITSKSFQVKEYSKPAYTIKLNPDKKAYFSWDKVNYDINANFYEGSPVPGLKLSYNYSAGDYNKNGSLVCDANGKSSVNLSTNASYKSWRPLNAFMAVNNAQAEDQEISAYNYSWVFTKDTIIEGKGIKNGDKETVEVSTNSIDLSKIRDINTFPDTDSFRGAPINTKVHANIYELSWNKKEVGEYYDFINKINVKKYEYYQVKNLIKNIDFTTSNGKYSFDFPIKKESSYLVELIGNDSRNNSIVEEIYLYPYEYYSGFANKNYVLTSDGESKTYKVGEKVNLEVKKPNTETTPSPDAKTLFLRFKDGLNNLQVVKGSTYSFDFTNDNIPNIYAMAVYFDGKHIYGAGTKEIRYDFKDKNLKIEFRTDKSEYKPGDNVDIEVSVKDSKGKPTAADVNLSVVDEAFFTLENQDVNTLESLYSYSVATGLISDYLSYTPVNFNPNTHAEQGGEGGDMYIRTKFKDNAFFKSLTTDSSGKAKATFKLPDNLTSWRVTYQAVSGNISAGSGRSNIIVRQPYFVDVIFNNIFLKGDNPNITARVFGTSVSAGNSVDYKIVLEDQKGQKKNIDYKGTSGAYTNIPLGSLETGDYTITITAVSGNLKDGIKKSFKVVDNILEAARSDSKNLSSDISLKGGKTLTKLVFYNNDTTQIYDTLNSLRYSWGERVDQRLSRKIASELLKKYYNENMILDETDDNFSDYQTDDGGIAVLKYGSSDPVLSAKICSIGKNMFDQSALKSYFYRLISNRDSTAEAVAAAYWGLSSLNEPVLIDVKNLLNSSSISIKEKVYLALALAELGDCSKAKEYYKEITSKYGKNAALLYYIDMGSSRDDTMEFTALCSLIAYKINAPEKLPMVRYIESSETTELLTNLEKLYVVQNNIPDCRQTGKFTYLLDGKSKEIIINKNEKFEMVLTAEKLQNIKFSNVQGDIYVMSTYTGPVTDLAASGTNVLKLTRDYSVNKVLSTSFKQSDLIQINLKFDFNSSAPDGFYEITDILPSGLKYVSATKYDPKFWYPSRTEGQKVVFYYYYNKKQPQPGKTITYYARAAMPGMFTSDSAVIKNYISDISGFAPRQTINIGN